MKKFGLILAGCLAFIGFAGAHAEDIGDVARAAVRRASTQATTSSRGTPTTNSTRTNTGTTHTAPTVRNRGATTPSRTSAVVERTTTNAARTTQNVIPRATISDTTQTRNATTATRTSARATTQSNVVTRGTQRTTSRAAKAGEVTREDILTRDYSKCKKVFFDCMDEFCANKDAQLKRCACSSRIHEFDSVKKQLAATEEKILDFNQRLLTVSMDKEDAEALSIATEGEEAYLATKDKSDSKKTLDAIAQKLKTSFDSSNFNTDLNVLSWSLNADSAFDSVDSLMGASTTAKSGTALFSAALPVCREMAAEVCSESDIKLVEGGYQALIEQDCNTVAKTYQSQVDQARAKVLEGSALLDMSRLDTYQKRNSDDILTCKKKMLDMLTNSTVCGTDLENCLDVTGQYIDPSTGEAFLTPNLVNLGTLLTRPTGDYTWSTVPSNATFVSFLNSKRKFLEPAMEQCQDIADSVWNSFIDDALSQIKLAQNKKLEQVRQGCTTLTAQCLSNASESIVKFDARALSTFGISADITANAMCQNVIDSCNVLLESNDASEWITGISEIITSNTDETLIQTCNQVGRACIIQVCSSTSGNFGLCESISNSTNRKAIINHTACWDQVKECIASAGSDNIDKIIQQRGLDVGMNLNFYGDMYANYDPSNITSKRSDDIVNSCIATNDGAETPTPIESTCVLDLCYNECSGETATLNACRVCRLAESIWGNCEVDPTTPLSAENTHNKIKQPIDTTNPTLLYWFATNTGTVDANDNCRDTTCGIGYVPYYNDNSGVVECIEKSNMCYARYDSPSAEEACRNDNQFIKTMSSGANNCQCCNVKDSMGNCCESGFTIPGVPGSTNGLASFCVSTGTTDGGTGQFIGGGMGTGNTFILICDGGKMTVENGTTPHCTGRLVVITPSTDQMHYSSPTDSGFVTESFASSTGQCDYDRSENKWKKTADGSDCDTTPTHWSIIHNNN